MSNRCVQRPDRSPEGSFGTNSVWPIFRASRGFISFGYGDHNVPDSGHDLQVTASPNSRSDAHISKLVPVPDFLTLSRRGHGLSRPSQPRTKRTDTVHLVVDSTGLKVFGKGEWLQPKHKTKAKRKRWVLSH